MICHSSRCCDMPEARICEMRLYWVPTSPSMFSHFGLLASAGVLSGSSEMWQAPHDMPMRNCGSDGTPNSPPGADYPPPRDPPTDFAKASHLSKKHIALR